MSKEYARAELLRIAHEIVDGRVRPLAGACALCGHLHAVEGELNRNSRDLIVGVASECDGLPLGSERQYWAPEALREKDKKADEYEQQVGQDIIQVARELLVQFSGR